MKKFLFCLAVFVCLLFTACTTEILGDTPSMKEAVTLSSATEERPIVDYGSATNVVIFICFSDENPNEIRAAIPADFDDRCNGTDNSIYDYYRKLSYGRFSFNSLFPLNNDGSFYIYQDSHNRSYYLGNDAESGSKRTGPESNLLNNAVWEASSHFTFGRNILDINGDDYVDCVTFIISGGYTEKNWNTLMWPHSWQLDAITKEYDSRSSSAYLGGKQVNDYTFLFLDTVSSRVGLMCHELGHAVGDLPDLYHYNSSYSKYHPVGYWDLMHLDCDTPQYMTTYLRWKYLSFVNDNQIIEMEKSGDYTLKPTTVASASDTLAYKLTIDNGTSSPNESIWIEYRRNDVSTYDSDLPGSGLIVYRINSRVSDGNKNARYHSESFPDEVFVFRPNFSKQRLISDREKENLYYAWLSNDNPYFSVLGNVSSKENYDDACIYLSNGKNTGIVITVIAESRDSVTFHIELGNYDSSEIDYKASYVKGNTKTKDVVEVYYGEDIKSKINLFVKRKNRGVYRADDDSITLLGGDDLYQVCEAGKNAYLEYTDSYGTYRFTYFLIIHDKLESYTATVLSYPNKTSYEIGETLSLAGFVIQVRYASGIRTISYSSENQSIWQTYGFESDRSGYKDILVIYNDDVKIHFSVFVKSNLLSLRVDEKNTCHLKGLSTVPSFNVIGTYAGGYELALEDDEYVIETGMELDYKKTTVTITSTAKDTISCTSFYYKVPVAATAITLLTDPKKTYKYGEALDLTGGQVRITFGDFILEEALPLINFRAKLKNYDPTKVGRQTLRFNLENAAFAMDVNVLSLTENLFSLQGEEARIDEGAKSVVLEKDCTIAFLTDRIASAYLTASFTYTVGEDSFVITKDSSGDLLIQSNVKIVLQNTDGQVIRSYSVYRSGDGNNDGKLTEKDVFFWQRAIIAKDEVSKGQLFDKNGDKRYTLTDYVLLLDELKKEAQ